MSENVKKKRQFDPMPLYTLWHTEAGEHPIGTPILGGEVVTTICCECGEVITLGLEEFSAFIAQNNGRFDLLTYAMICGECVSKKLAAKGATQGARKRNAGKNPL